MLSGTMNINFYSSDVRKFFSFLPMTSCLTEQFGFGDIHH